MRVPLANVTTADTRYVKARVEIDRAVVVHDVVTGAVLAEFPGPVTRNGDTWAAPGVEIVVSESDCLCGGTAVQPLTRRRWVRRSPARRAGGLRESVGKE